MASKEWREQLVPFFEKGVHPSVEVGNGWKNIVLSMVTDIRELYPEWRIHSIKERFGDLNVSYTLGPEVDTEVNEKITRIIHLAERRARETCIICASEESDICSINYIPHVYCDTCRESRKEELKANAPVITG